MKVQVEKYKSVGSNSIHNSEARYEVHIVPN